MTALSPSVTLRLASARRLRGDEPGSKVADGKEGERVRGAWKDREERGKSYGWEEEGRSGASKALYKFTFH